MTRLDENAVSQCLEGYFASRGLGAIRKFNLFDHADDSSERSFEIDFAVCPVATKGARTYSQVERDRARFEEAADQIDPIINELAEISLFPGNSSFGTAWSKAPNLNPMVGVAIEIENNMSKYFLGSLFAAAIAGRWGVLLIRECPEAEPWISTVRRMIHKGTTSPIPSNIVILYWPTLETYVQNG